MYDFSWYSPCELCLHEKTIRSIIDLLFSRYPMGITENKKFVKKKTKNMHKYRKKWIYFEKTFYRKMKNMKNTFPTTITEKYKILCNSINVISYGVYR